jgi:transposase-like protein
MNKLLNKILIKLKCKIGNHEFYKGYTSSSSERYICKNCRYIL